MCKSMLYSEMGLLHIRTHLIKSFILWSTQEIAVQDGMNVEQNSFNILPHDFMS